MDLDMKKKRYLSDAHSLSGSAGAASQGVCWHSFAKLAPRCWQPSTPVSMGVVLAAVPPASARNAEAWADVPGAECHGRGIAWRAVAGVGVALNCPGLAKQINSRYQL
ncbi:hypothetical protein OIU74_006897, partial [Salix koriyanagi]